MTMVGDQCRTSWEQIHALKNYLFKDVQLITTWNTPSAKALREAVQSDEFHDDVLESKYLNLTRQPLALTLLGTIGCIFAAHLDSLEYCQWSITLTLKETIFVLTLSLPWFLARKDSRSARRNRGALMCFSLFASIYTRLFHRFYTSGQHLTLRFTLSIWLTSSILLYCDKSNGLAMLSTVLFSLMLANVWSGWDVGLPVFSVMAVTLSAILILRTKCDLAIRYLFHCCSAFGGQDDQEQLPNKSRKEMISVLMRALSLLDSLTAFPDAQAVQCLLNETLLKLTPMIPTKGQREDPAHISDGVLEAYVGAGTMRNLINRNIVMRSGDLDSVINVGTPRSSFGYKMPWGGRMRRSGTVEDEGELRRLSLRGRPSATRGGSGRVSLKFPPSHLPLPGENVASKRGEGGVLNAEGESLRSPPLSRRHVFNRDLANDRESAQTRRGLSSEEEVESSSDCSVTLSWRSDIVEKKGQRRRKKRGRREASSASSLFPVSVVEGSDAEAMGSHERGYCASYLSNYIPGRRIRRNGDDTIGGLADFEMAKPAIKQTCDLFRGHYSVVELFLQCIPGDTEILNVQLAPESLEIEDGYEHSLLRPSVKQFSNDWFPVLHLGYAYLKQFTESGPFGADTKRLQLLLYTMNHMYFANEYHNAYHAAQVMHSATWLLRTLFAKIRHLTNEEHAAFALACLAHDIAHPGRTNGYFVARQNPLAIIFNDNSVLENFHASLLFTLLARDEFNILEYASRETFFRMRKLIVELILSTDMASHFELITQWKIRAASEDFDPCETDKNDLLCLLIKCGDLSHSTLPWVDHVEWSRRVQLEFFEQGDEEAIAGLPISPLCDRKAYSEKECSSGQIVFLNAVVMPLFRAVASVDEGGLINRVCLPNIISNVQQWECRKNSAQS